MTAAPTATRASILTTPSTLTVSERQVPQLRATDVLVQVLSVGVCGSDVHYYRHGRIGDFVVTGELVLGHEASGVIAAVGAEVDPARIGERVSVEPQRECGACASCRSGDYNLCPKMEFLATPPFDGAFTEYVAVPAHAAHPVPDSLSFDEAALLEPLSVAIAACRRAQVQPGSRVLITGAGPVGLLIASTARVFGASRVVISDPIASRRAHAIRRGADRAIDPTVSDEADGEIFDIFIDASGVEPAINWALRHCASGGFALLVGMGSSQQRLETGLIQAREITLSGIFRYRHTWPLAIELATSGRITLSDLVTGHFGLDEVEEALTAISTDFHLKTMVHPSVAVGDQWMGAEPDEGGR